MNMTSYIRNMVQAAAMRGVLLLACACMFLCVFASQAAALEVLSSNAVGSIEVSGIEAYDTVYLYRITTEQVDGTQLTTLAADERYAGIDMARLALLGTRTGGRTAEDDQADIALLAAAAQTGAPDAAAQVPEGAAGVTFNALPMGYYLVTVSPLEFKKKADGTGPYVYQAMVAPLVPHEKGGTLELHNVTVVPKSSTLSITKHIRDGFLENMHTDIFGVGQLVPFTVDALVPQYALVDYLVGTQAAPARARISPLANGPLALLAEPEYSHEFTIVDDLPQEFAAGTTPEEGLAELQVSAAGQVVDPSAYNVSMQKGYQVTRQRTVMGADGEPHIENYNQTVTRYTFTFDYEQIKRFAGQVLTVFYRSKLESEWEPLTLESTAELVFSTEPYNANSPTDSASATVTQQTYGIYAVKRSAETGEPLAGAEFTVYRRVETLGELEERLGRELGQYQYEQLESSDMRRTTLYRAGGSIEVVELSTSISDEEGIARLGGLGLGGIYYVQETQAPTGYDRIESIEEIQLTQDRIDTDAGDELYDYEFVGDFNDAKSTSTSRGSITLPSGDVVPDDPQPAPGPGSDDPALPSPNPDEVLPIPLPEPVNDVVRPVVDAAGHAAQSVVRAAADPVGYVRQLPQTGDYAPLVVLAVLVASGVLMVVAAHKRPRGGKHRK